jgi:pimeloyl-ACP methyl ester carboxylesterase
MQKITFTNSRNLTLAGNLYLTGSKAIVILAHGFTNDKSSQGRFDKLAEALNGIGYDGLTFDFSGCGESDPDIITVGNEVDDLKSAIKYVKSNGYEKVALFGNSLGTLICLKCFQPEVITMVLSGALTDGMRYDWNKYFSTAQMEELNQKGYLTIKDSQGIRRVGRQMLLDFEQIDQQELLKNVTCPILIIHGDSDEDVEEKQLLERSKRAMTMLSSDSQLVVITGGKHGLREHWGRVIEFANDWYIRYLGQ